LPRALRTFKLSRGAAKESKVFYRYALKALLADPFQRSVLDIVIETTSGGATPEQAFESKTLYSFCNQVGEELQKLPDQARTAVRLYFGLPAPPNETPEREHTLLEIAHYLKCSEYSAREAVVDGLAELAVRLRVRGPFSKQERELMYYVFLERMDLQAAADHMSMHLTMLVICWLQ
jgi:hypothetical protein